MKNLIQKYNVPAPRYTSYPTVPFWKESQMKQEEWFAAIQRNLDFFASNEVSLYIHLPFCESMCTFCGCFKRITKNHAFEKPYINGLIKEWSVYRENFDLKIKELHLGGGTPTFFSPENLEVLIREIIQDQDVSDCDLSFEAHPNNTTAEHLLVLFHLGFRRLSLGVQDYDPTVQEAIHRFQTVEQLKEVHDQAKRIGFTSVSHDLVYGLPKQNLEGFTKTVEETIKILPDRISLYSYAHVPWIKGNGQRGFSESDLPADDEKRNLYEKAKEMLLSASYLEIGMDHFALPEDELSVAWKNKTLHRNFMGYTTQKTNLLIGLGASAISDSWFAFAQNTKSVDQYVQDYSSKLLSLEKGHFLSEEDLELRTNILELMCRFETKIPDDETLMHKIRQSLEPLEEDGLLEIKNNHVLVHPAGVPFIRNICMAFDNYLPQNERLTNTFSKTI